MSETSQLHSVLQKVKKQPIVFAMLPYSVIISLPTDIEGHENRLSKIGFDGSFPQFSWLNKRQQVDLGEAHDSNTIFFSVTTFSDWFTLQIATVLLLGGITRSGEQDSKVQLTVKAGQVTRLWILCLLIILLVSVLNLLLSPLELSDFATSILILFLIILRLYMNYVNKMHILKSYLDAMSKLPR